MIEKVGPSLPFPGDKAAELVLAVFDVVDLVVANKANIAELRSRAVAFLDILHAYHPELGHVRKYKGVVDGYLETLEGIIAYSREFTGRNCVVRLLKSSIDADHYEDLVKKMGSLNDQVMMVVAADNNARLQGLQDAAHSTAQRLAEVAAAVAAAVALLEQPAEYKDPTAGARELIEELGGIEAVVADSANLARVKKKLGTDQQILLEMLESHLDRTPQRFIHQYDLRRLWKRHFQSEGQVPWFIFWEVFPEKLVEEPPGLAPELVSELAALLQGDAARRAFQAALERQDGDTVSVWELRTFAGNEELLPQVSRLLLRATSGGTTAVPTPVGAPQPAAGPAETSPTALHPATTLGGTPAGQPAASTGFAASGARCQLPPLAAHFSGREEEAADLASHLLTRGSVLLRAPGGMGKSSLAAAVGWRLLHGGQAPRGALWVDLREAGSRAEVEARFCAALGLQTEKSGNAGSILKALARLAAAEPGGSLAAGQTACPPMAALVVVDNAEDALLGVDAAVSLRDLVQEVLRSTPSVRLLLTSRVSLGLTSNLLITEREVGSISPAAAAKLVRTIAEDLSEPEAKHVAECCGYVPLVLCLVSEALVAGRLTLDDLSQMSPITGAATVTATAAAAASELSMVDTTAATVSLVLRGLKRQHLNAAAYVAVFPSAFDAEAAAEVMGCTSVSQARGMLSVLCRYSVLQASGSGGGGASYTMHMVVRQQVTAAGRSADPGLQRRAEGRFVRRMLCMLREYSDMYRTANEWRLALAAARDSTADIAKLLELLEDGGEGSGVDPCEVAEALTGNLRLLFDGLGLLGRLEPPCRGLLRRLEGEGADPSAEEASEDGAAGGYTDANGGRGQGQEEPQREDAAKLLAVASALFMFAWTKLRIGPKKGGEPAARRAWQLRRRLLGEQHPDTASALQILAILINETGNRTRCKEAEPLYRQHLAVRRTLLGEDHPDTVASVLSLAICLKDQGRLQAAQELYEQVVVAREKLLGKMHPDTAAALNYLAVCFRMQDRLKDAEQLYRRAVAVGARALGKEHRQVGVYLENLAKCVAAQGRQLNRGLALAEALKEA